MVVVAVVVAVVMVLALALALAAVAVMLAQPEIETIEALLRLVLEGQAPPS